MSDPADEPDGITEPPADVVARLAAQASQADLESWAYDEGLDPDDPTTVDAWTDYNVEQAERRAEDAEWARGCW